MGNEPRMERPRSPCEMRESLRQVEEGARRSEKAKVPEDGGLINQAFIGLKPVNACVHTYTKPQTSSTRSRGLGWRIHESVEDTKLSTNKQHSLPGNIALQHQVALADLKSCKAALSKSAARGGGGDGTWRRSNNAVRRYTQQAVAPEHAVRGGRGGGASASGAKRGGGAGAAGAPS
jgi:hypothetical protein